VEADQVRLQLPSPEDAQRDDGADLQANVGAIQPQRPLRNGDVTGVRLPTSDRPLVSVIIPCFGKPWLTLQCLKSIARFPRAAPFEVVVVDDASGGAGVQILSKVAGLRLEINSCRLLKEYPVWP
jgi:cellulose synthase/poly-beta-1,6-N-acetylglucosamine synthase-like glycosyltransferase